MFIFEIFKPLNSYFKYKTITLLILIFVGMMVEIVSIGAIFPFLVMIISNDTEQLKFLPFIADLSIGQSEMLLILLLIYLFKSIYLTYIAWYQAKVTAQLSKFISDKIYNNYLFKNWNFYLNTNSAKLISYSTREVDYFTFAWNSCLVLYTEIFLFLGVMILLLFISFKVSLFIISMLITVTSVT